MSEWKEYKFSDFVDINHPVKLQKGEIYSFVEMKDLSDGQKFCFPNATRQLSGGSRFENGDTLFARITPCLENGKICQVRELKNGVGFGSTEFLVFRGKQNVSDTDFIFYLSRWDEVRGFAEMNFDGTSGRQRVPKEVFDNLCLELPYLPEQRSIASILSSLDDKIDLLHRQNKTLEALAETLFRQWFVEDKVWNGKLSEYIKVQGGFAFKSEKFKEVGFAGIIKITNISMGSVDIRNTQFVDEEIVKDVDEDKFRIRTGDFLIAMTGAEIGKIGIVEKTDKQIWLNQRVGKLIEKVPYGNLVGYLALKSREGQEHIMNTCSGSAQENISSSGIENMDFVPYSEDIVNQFGVEGKTLFEKEMFNMEQIRTLTQLRDRLLPKLMSGEIRLNYDSYD
ncbi:MAG: restriction endonuclease subunit S [Bacteroidota bacterium]|nr:restriction endonuclease subunit S [Bacteroidota bacterium]